MPVTRKEFTTISARIRSADPSLHKEFIALLESYTSDVTVAVISASTDEVLRAQGRAQQAHKFLLLFTDTLNLPGATSP